MQLPDICTLSTSAENDDEGRELQAVGSGESYQLPQSVVLGPTSFGSPSSLRTDSASTKPSCALLESIPTTPPSISRLPPELILRILELAILGRAPFLRTRLLLSTSVVARAWTGPSQLLLKSRIIIGSDGTVEWVLPLLKGRWAKELRFEKTVKELGAVMVDEVLESVKGVKRLVLDRVECSPESLMGKSMAGLRSLELHATLSDSLLHHYHFSFGLQHLSLHASHANHPSLLSALLTFPHLTSVGLVWGRCTSFDVATISALVGVAHRLEHLHLDLLEIAEPLPPAELAMLLACCTSLRSLTIRGLEIESLLPILSSLAPPTRLVLLELHFPLFYNLAAADLARTFREAMRLPALQALKRWRMENLKQMRLDEAEGAKWREECERRGVDEKRI